jgi:hypothetical protein
LRCWRQAFSSPFSSVHVMLGFDFSSVMWTEAEDQ